MTNTQSDPGEPPSAAELQFVPIELAPTAGEASATEAAMPPTSSDIHIELTRGGTQLSVLWPSAQARIVRGLAA